MVAVVSGRSAAFLADRLELDRYSSPLRAIGLHGLEEWTPDGALKLRPGVSAWRPVIETVGVALRAALPQGVRVEDKGYGITVHWRSVTTSGAELAALAAAATDTVQRIGVADGLLARLGKASVELAPPLGIDKGVVVKELCDGLEAAGYMGDDLGDLLGFQALEQLRNSSVLAAVKVAVSGEEAPRQLLEEADLVLEDPSAAGRFLEALAESVRRRR